MKDLEVSIVKYLCPVCGKVAEEGIIMNSLLTEENARNVKDLNGKAIGYSNHVCKECSKYSKDVVFIIGIDETKSKEDLYRTGDIVGIKRNSSLANHIKSYTKTLKDGSIYCFMDKKIGEELGLWKNVN